MRCSVFVKESHDKHMQRISLPSHQPAHGYPSNTSGDPPVPLFPSLRTVLKSLLICYGSITATLMCTISLSPVYRPALTRQVIDFGHDRFVSNLSCRSRHPRSLIPAVKAIDYYQLEVPCAQSVTSCAPLHLQLTAH